MNIVIKDDVNEEILSLRYEVFCVEQHVSKDEEFDGKDKGKIHICYYQNNILIGYCRAFLDGDEGHIGRVLVKKDHRMQGIGREVIFAAEKELSKFTNKMTLNAQTQAIGFYEKLGYSKIGNLFYEANIPHYTMKKMI